MKKILLCLVLLVYPASARAWEAGVAPATRKILPETPAPAEKAITLNACRNEWEAFQIVIRDPAGAKNVNVELDGLSGPSAAVIPASAARFYREVYLDVTNSSAGSLTYHERVPGLYPDPLVPFTDPYSNEKAAAGAPFDLGPGETGTVFIDILVPEDAAPGAYEGTAAVTASGKEAVEMTVFLTVWEIDIPKERTIGTAFGFSKGAVRSFHGGPSGPPAEGYADIVDRYFLAMHEHRIDPTWIGGGVEFKFDEAGGLLPIDWAEYDAEVGPWLDGSRFPDGIGVARFNAGYFQPGSGTGSMTEEQYSRAAAAFAEHLDEKGWWEHAYIYSVDEPWLNGGRQTYDRINADGNLLFKYTDLWKGHVLVTSPFDPAIAGVIGIWCPVTPMYEDWYYKSPPKPGRQAYAERLALGEKLWFYVCNHNTPPYAGYDIDTTIGYEPRIVKWGTWYEKATGFLYWDVNYWVQDDPWNVFLNVEQFTEFGARNGDGMLIYPGDHDGTAGGKGSPGWLSLDGPIVSYRLKQIRDGLEDWELFRLAEELGAEEYAREQVGRAYTRFGDIFFENCNHPQAYCADDQPWTLDENVLFDAREKVAQKILFLLHPDRYEDPEKPEPPENPQKPAAEDSGCSGCNTGAGAAGEWLGLALLCVAFAGRQLRRRRAI